MFTITTRQPQRKRKRAMSVRDRLRTKRRPIEGKVSSFYSKPDIDTSLEKKLETAKRIYNSVRDEGKILLFMPNEWWERQYHTDPTRYYEWKFGNYTRAIICTGCDNRRCGYWPEPLPEKGEESTWKCKECRSSSPKTPTPLHHDQYAERRRKFPHTRKLASTESLPTS